MDLHELTDDALTGGFRVYQRRRGHRYSLDDVLTAHEALQQVPEPQRCLDLGCGIGSVLLMIAYKRPAAALVGIEAQAQSLALARRNVERNGVDGRVRLHHGDVRDGALLAAVEPPFSLVTGTPPYQPPGAGTVSPDRQRAHARVELRGGVEVYLQAAAQTVAADGHVVLCADARTPQRVERAAQAVGLHPQSVREAVPAVRKGPLFAVWVLRPFATGGLQRLPAFVARDSSGARTADSRALRAFFDLLQADGETASPVQRPRRVERGVSHG